MRERAAATTGHGGARRGAGRKKRSDESIPHTARPAVDGDHPLHITIRIARGVWNLRSQRGFRAVRDALEQEKKRGDLRIVEYSVQGDRLHVIAETSDRITLTRRMQGLGVRFARSVNAMMGRKRGRVIAERSHLHVLRTPREVRNAVRYVLLNHVKHFGKGSCGEVCVDPFSSGPWFQHFAASVQPSRWRPCLDPPTRAPESWLLRAGWRRAGATVGRELAVVRYPRMTFGDAGRRELAKLRPAGFIVAPFACDKHHVVCVRPLEDEIVLIAHVRRTDEAITATAWIAPIHFPDDGLDRLGVGQPAARACHVSSVIGARNIALARGPREAGDR